MQNRALVTGASGFIGTALSKRLISEGVQVAAMPRAYLQSPVLCSDYVKKVNPSYIFHLAAYGNHSTQKDVSEHISSNILKTYFMLDAARQLKSLKSFVNFGSSSEYGIKSQAMSEGDLPEADTFYGVTKIAGTYLTRAFARQYNMPAITVRPFSVYGEGEADFRLIPTLIKQATEDTPFTIDPEPVHDWIYIEDFIDGVYTVAVGANDVKGMVFNIGTGEQSTNEQVAREIANIAGVKYRVKPFERRPNEAKSWRADTTILTALGWKPLHTLHAGLENTYKFYKQKYATERSGQNGASKAKKKNN